MPPRYPLTDDVPDRPPFMAVLGLLPPYERDDVEAAYAGLTEALVGAGHDDATLGALRSAYEDASGFLEIHGSRRHWLGRHVTRYTERIALMDAVAAAGGHCTRETPDRYRWVYGDDFAEVMRPVLSLTLSGPGVDDESLAIIEQHSEVAAEILSLDLRDARISDAGLSRLARCTRLRGLHLGGTPVTARGLKALEALTSLEWLHIGDTRIGLITRRRIARANPRLTIALARGEEPPPVGDRAFEHARLVDRIAQLNR